MFKWLLKRESVSELMKRYSPELYEEVDKRVYPYDPVDKARQVINDIMEEIGSDYIIAPCDEKESSIIKAGKIFRDHRRLKRQQDSPNP